MSELFDKVERGGKIKVSLLNDGGYGAEGADTSAVNFPVTLLGTFWGCGLVRILREDLEAVGFDLSDWNYSDEDLVFVVRGGDNPSEATLLEVLSES